MVTPFMNETLDGLVPPSLVDAIFESVHQPVYKFGQKSNPGDSFAFWIANISSEVLGTVAPLKALWDLVDGQVAKGACDTVRMYVNAYNFGDCPTVHADSDDEGFYTVIYYANNDWSYDWSGETVFYNQAKTDITKAVYPTPGRIVLFDSRIPHVARTPSRSCPFVRYTIALKLKAR